MCSLLKPLVVRHSKNAERDGAALVALPPLEARDDRAVHVKSDLFDKLAAKKQPECRLHAAAQALKPLDWLCAGVDPAERHKHDSIAGASNLDKLPVNVPRRPDAEATADTVATQDLHAFRRDLDENLRSRGTERRRARRRRAATSSAATASSRSSRKLSPRPRRWRASSTPCPTTS
jgi:hypothetical protein